MEAAAPESSTWNLPAEVPSAGECERSETYGSGTKTLGKAPAELGVVHPEVAELPVESVSVQLHRISMWIELSGTLAITARSWVERTAWPPGANSVVEGTEWVCAGADDQTPTTTPSVWAGV